MDGVDLAIFLATLYGELTKCEPRSENLPILCFTDNKSLVDAVESRKPVTEKRLRVEISCLKELLDTKQVKDGLIQNIKWLTV